MVGLVNVYAQAKIDKDNDPGSRIHQVTVETKVLPRHYISHICKIIYLYVYLLNTNPGVEDKPNDG